MAAYSSTKAPLYVVC